MILITLLPSGICEVNKLDSKDNRYISTRKRKTVSGWESEDNWEHCVSLRSLESAKISWHAPYCDISHKKDTRQREDLSVNCKIQLENTWKSWLIPLRNLLTVDETCMRELWKKIADVARSSITFSWRLVSYEVEYHYTQTA